MNSPYALKPNALFKRLDGQPPLVDYHAYCVGFECEAWRCDAYADHLMDWIIDYALKAEELKTLTHVNSYVRLKEAAARIYKSEHYETRGEVGEISIHAICRGFFDTIPFAPRVFYLTSSNEVVKSFDMVHVRYLSDDDLELWLGEAKFYKSRSAAVASAITSVKAHIDKGFLKNEKLLLGPQVSTAIPSYDKIRQLLSQEESLDTLFNKAVFPIFIATDSSAVNQHKSVTAGYVSEVAKELASLADAVAESGLAQKIKLMLIYVPLKSKDDLAAAFDKRLKGLST